MLRTAMPAVFLLISGCVGGEMAREAPALDEPKYYGTNANLAPSEPDAILRYADHARGAADLRLPSGDGPFPLAVIYHGGCWKTGIATQHYMAPLATRWQEQGIATLNIDYREVGDGGGWSGSFEDWQASTALIDQVARDYPIDRERVTLVGHSAGALPAQWLASERGVDSPVGAQPAVRARAAIVFDGPADVGLEREAFDALCQFSAVDPFMGGSPSEQAARYAAIAPGNAKPQLEELLFVQAVLEPAPESAQTALQAGGLNLSILPNPDASHFDIITPGAPLYLRNEQAVMRVLRGR